MNKINKSAYNNENLIFFVSWGDDSAGKALTTMAGDLGSIPDTQAEGKK